MIHAQNLYRFALHSVGNDIGHLWNDEFAGAGHAAGTSYMRVVGQQVFDITKDAKDDPARAGGTLFSD